MVAAVTRMCDTGHVNTDTNTDANTDIVGNSDSGELVFERLAYVERALRMLGRLDEKQPETSRMRAFRRVVDGLVSDKRAEKTFGSSIKRVDLVYRSIAKALGVCVLRTLWE